MNKNLYRGAISGFIRSAEKFPNRPALEVDNRIFTYGEMWRDVRKLSTMILKNESPSSHFLGILAHRSHTAYAGVLSIIASGKGYVPLNPKFPIERTIRMMSLSELSMVVVGNEAIEQLKGILSIYNKPLTIILPDLTTCEELSALFAGHHFVTSEQMAEECNTFKIAPVASSAYTYLLFTSGTTGLPKGIPVSQKNLNSYIEYTCNRYQFNEYDRFSQTFDLTFDLSVHDMFICWQSGGCLCCIPDSSVMAPGKFIKDKELTVWFSVPSVAMFMAKMRMVKPGTFPILRYSLFCGEALPAAIAEMWQLAAPNSIVENLYGPTEATIAISNYRWKSNKSSKESLNGIVPIGRIYDGHKSCVIDTELRPVPVGKKGELCLSGDQITNGYLNNPSKTKEQFINIPDFNAEEIWYRTGDLVIQNNDKCLYYLGRIDHQIKIQGFRVELLEIDSVLRKAAKTELAITVAWPIRGGKPEGVIGFLSGCEENEKKVIEFCKKELPQYMVPKRVFFIDKMPLNENGKIDRLRLTQILENGDV